MVDFELDANAAYDKRKYMWKLLYTRMLGYDVEFGQKQAMDLIAASGFAEKQVGYVACGFFLNEKDELLRLVINSVRNDLVSRNEAFQSLALDFIANVGGAEFAQLLMADVMAVLSNGATRPVVRKKAALCLLRLIRKVSLDSEIMPSSEWGNKIAAMLEERDPGLLLGLTTLLFGIVSRNYEGYEMCVPHLVKILDRLKARDVPHDYTYFGLAAPWLQVRTLRVLQYFPPPEDPAVLRALIDTLKRILAGNEPIKNTNKNNAVHAIVFEAAALAVGLGDAELLNLGLGLLARFLTVREANLRYLALENMGRLAQAPEVAEAVARHQKTVITCLQDPDDSIRRRALDLVFTTATATSAPAAVDELLAALPRADYGLREELVLKAAVLAERFPPSSEWYVDSMLRLMEAAGDSVVEDVWHSVIQVIAAEPTLHRHAVSRTVEALKRGAAAESFLRCASFVLGEFGTSLADEMPPLQQFKLLHARFPAATMETKAMMLTAYEKMWANAPTDSELASVVQSVLSRYINSIDAEIQQRAIEYQKLAQLPQAATLALAPLPPWEKRTSLLLRRLTERQGIGEDEARDQPAWMQSEDMRKGGREIQKDEAIAVGENDIKISEGEETVHEAKSEEVKSAPSTVAAVPDLLDLLDLNGEPGEEPNNESVTDMATLSAMESRQASTSTSANPFATGDEEQQEPHGSQGLAERGMEPVGNVAAWFAALCRSTTGVLYEDSNLQIGIKMSCQGPEAQLGIFLGNKSRVPLERLVCLVPPSPAFTLTLGVVPHTLMPGTQMLVTLAATCVAPFLRPPVLQIGYSCGVGTDTLHGGMHGPHGIESNKGSMARTLDLPLIPTKFCQPVDIPASVFSTRWAQVVGAPFKLSQQVYCHLNQDQVSALLSMLQLQVLPDADTTLGTVCAAGVFHCGPPPYGRQIPCMVKVEGIAPGGSWSTLTVATADAMVTDSLREHLAQQLSTMKNDGPNF